MSGKGESQWSVQKVSKKSRKIISVVLSWIPKIMTQDLKKRSLGSNQITTLFRINRLFSVNQKLNKRKRKLKETHRFKA